MPTARELLEQADALMRRRHEAAEPRIAEDDSVAPMQRAATDALPAAAEAGPAAGPHLTPPRAAVLPSEPPSAGAAGEPAAKAAPAVGVLSSVAWSAPAPPAASATTSPAFAPTATRSPRAIQREPIAPSFARAALPVEPAEPPVFTVPSLDLDGAAAAAAEQDFPVLTDAVAAEEIAHLSEGDDVPLLTDAVDAAADEAILEDLDEPSVWSPTAGGPPSVSARGPASVAPFVAPEAPVPDRDPLGLDQPPPGFQPPPGAQWSEPPVVLTEAEPTIEPEAGDVVDLSMERASIDEATGLASGHEVDRVEPVLAQAWKTVGVEHPQEASLAAGPAPEASAVQGPAPAAGPHALLDDARVREIAEEIGMQVLQRIDIFTDTELRARLGERLKPVVDRVSAELVVAINQHVGELLRSYVAEAIEREIDRWRSGGS